MLLCLSRRGFCVFGHAKFAVDFVDDIAFQAPIDLALAFALSGAFDHIVFCGFMIPQSGDGDEIEGSICRFPRGSEPDRRIISTEI